MLGKLWNDIQLIYDGFNFSSKLLIDNLMIISQDNYYLLLYLPPKEDVHTSISTQIRIEKDYNLVRIWGGDVPYDMVNYKIHVEVGSQIELDENYKIELAYKIITPFLREVKLNKIGV